MRDRVVEVMAAVFGLPVEDILDSMAMGRSKNWDSLKHMNLILALEDEFGIVFTDEETTEMMSLPLILEILRGKKIC